MCVRYERGPLDASPQHARCGTRAMSIGRSYNQTSHFVRKNTPLPNKLIVPMVAVAGWKKNTPSFVLTKCKDKPLLGDKRTLLLHTSAWPGQAKH